MHVDVMIRNNYEPVEVSDLKVGDIFLFEDEAEDVQGHYVSQILKTRTGNIVVCYLPEWTPVRSESMFHYGMKKFRLKNLVVSK